MVRSAPDGSDKKKTKWVKRPQSLHYQLIIIIKIIIIAIIIIILYCHWYFFCHSRKIKNRTKDMTTCQRVLLKLGTTHPTSQINWVWYQSAVCVLIFKEKTTSPNWTGDDLDQSETSSHDSRVMARLPFFLFPLLWTNEKRLLLWLCRTGSPVYHMRSVC